MDALNAAGRELQAIGNNLNQIAQQPEHDRRATRLDELRQAPALFEKSEAQHIAAIERVLAL